MRMVEATSHVVKPNLIRSLRTVASTALLGAVVAGMLFGWAPITGVHEIGAVIGAGLGVLANAKHFV